MIRKTLLAVSIAAAAGCSNNGPSDKQVKQALYDYYATANSEDELKKALGSEVDVQACRQDGPGYRCAIENKALGASIEMLFTFDKNVKKWKFKKEG